MSEPNTPRPDADKDRRARIGRDAREWHTAMNSGAVDEATRQSFEAWLHASKEHKQAYFALEQMWRDLDSPRWRLASAMPMPRARRGDNRSDFATL